MRQIKIGNKLIGDGQPVLIVAELGYNFNTFDEALASVDAASEAGVDAIKIQTFRADTLTIRDIDFPAEAGGVNQYQEFKRYEISEEVHAAIMDRAEKRGLLFFSTPSHQDDVDLLERLKVPLYKIGSDDLTNLPLLQYVAAKGKPVIFSSGMATLSEVEEAIQAMQEAGGSNLILLQCVSNYPITDPAFVNLRVLQTYRQAFGIPVGLSDHTTSLSAAIAAVALGACVIERHFALSKELSVPDAFFSSDPAEMHALVRTIRETEQMLGDGVKRPAPSEVKMRKDTRKSIAARRAIAAGQAIVAEDLIVKRPAWGIPPREWGRVIGHRAARAICEDEILSWELLV